MKKLAYTEFATLSEAVAAAGLDLSYNPRAAADKIRMIENPPPRFAALKFKRAFVANGSVYFEVKAPDGLRVLNKFDPFMSALSDSGFRRALDSGDSFEFTESVFPCRVRKDLIESGGLYISADDV